jgi:hypothetical protein
LKFLLTFAGAADTSYMTHELGDTMNFIQGRRYRLTKDVKNPLLDRRRKSGADRLPWRAGDVFFCTYRSNTTTFNDSRGFRPDPIDFRHPAYAEFVAALEMLPESTDDALSSLPAWGPEDAAAIINELVLNGKISLDDVRAAVAAVASKS